MTDMPERIAAWRFRPEKADEWLSGGWSEDHDHKTKAYVTEDALTAAQLRIAQLEAVKAAADDLADRARSVFAAEYQNTKHIAGSKEYFDRNMDALVAYRKATEDDT